MTKKITEFRMVNGQWQRFHVDAPAEPPIVIVPEPPRRPTISLNAGAFADYRIAKQEAKRLADIIGATLLQDEKGKPRVVKGKAIRSFPTWLSAASWLLRIAQDMKNGPGP